MENNKTWEELVDMAKCPKEFTQTDIGAMVGTISEVNSFAKTSFTYSSGDSNDSRYDKIKEYTLGSIEVYTHGLEIWIDSDIFALTNEQIVLIDTISHQEYITVKKKMSDYVAFGALLGNGIAGSLIGAGIGALFGIGKKRVNVKGTFIRIVYWDVHERNLKYVMLDYEGKKEHLDAFVKLWEEQKRINIETGRKPEDCKTGCFGLLLLFTILTISASLAIYINV